MPKLPKPDQVVTRVQADLGRSALRARNGVRLIAGRGRPALAQSPKDTVWSAEKVQVWRYRNDTRTIGTPLLLVHSLVSRSYVFDLAPGNSFVEMLVGRGFDVYLIDWGVPDELESRNTLETYADDYLPRIVEAVARVSGSKDVNLLGYCFGGVLSLLYLAGHPSARVKSLAVMATPLDFAKMGPMSALLQHGRLDPEDVIDETGNVPGRTLLDAFRALQPTANITAYVTLFQHLWNDQFVAAYQMMTTWAKDHIPFPGAAFTQLALLMTRDNLLATGKFPLADRTVDLADIRVPFLNVRGENDHIVPPEANGNLADLVGSTDVEELRLPAGHVGLFVGAAARKRNLPAIADWFERHSDRLP